MLYLTKHIIYILYNIICGGILGKYNFSKKILCLSFFCSSCLYIKSINQLLTNKLKILLPLTFILYFFPDKYIELQYINYFYTDKQIIDILNDYRWNYQYSAIFNVSKLSNVKNKYLKLVKKIQIKRNYRFYKKKLMKYPEIENYIANNTPIKYLRFYTKKYNKNYLLYDNYLYKNNHLHNNKYKNKYYLKKSKKIVMKKNYIYYILKKMK
jgi:hypothetical protein